LLGPTHLGLVRVLVRVYLVAVEPFALETRTRRLGDRGFVPDEFVLSPAYPNPFNPATQIGYGVPVDGQVEIAIYNVVGQKIRTLVDGKRHAGRYVVRWDGRDDSGRVVPGGIYVCKMVAGDAFR